VALLYVKAELPGTRANGQIAMRYYSIPYTHTPMASHENMMAAGKSEKQAANTEYLRTDTLNHVRWVNTAPVRFSEA